MKAKDFFLLADDNQKFDICIDGLWLKDLFANEIVAALDHCMLYEEIFNIALFGNPIMHNEQGNPDNTLVVLECTRNFPIDYEWEIHRLLYN